MQAAEKKRVKEERDIVQRLRPFARLQTAEDYEVFAADILCMISVTSTAADANSTCRRGNAEEAHTRIAALSAHGSHHYRRY